MIKFLINSFSFVKFSSLTVEGTKNLLCGVLAGIRDTKLVYGMIPLSKFKKVGGIGGGKDPNKNLHSTEHHHCRTYATSIKGNNSKQIEFLKNASGQYVPKGSEYHPICISFINNKFVQTNLTHSDEVKGLQTIPVGKDNNGNDSFASVDLIVVDVDEISNSPEAFFKLNALRNYVSELKNKEELYPTTDLKLTYSRIGFAAQYFGYEWDSTVESKEEVIIKLENMIEDIEIRLNKTK